MQLIQILLLCVVSIHVAVGPPVNEKKKNEDEEHDKDENEITNEDDTKESDEWGLELWSRLCGSQRARPRGLPSSSTHGRLKSSRVRGDVRAPVNIEYNRYLKEVVTALESDPEFRAKLEKAEEVDIRTGKIAQELEYVNHQVRTKLDELKRQELERLRHLASKEFEIRNGLDREHLKIGPEHLDHANPHTFEIEDLRKLIAKTTADLAEADKKRREEFKEYEMQKEYEKQQRLQELDEENKKKLEEEYKNQEVKHIKHVPLRHPGSKQQLEEVWEKQDHMENQDFDPKTFFFLHDLDGNGVWDEAEVKALFLKELDKLYNSGAPEDDMRERVEEMERMREHVFSEADTNKDGLISFQEFLSQTRKPEFEKDQGWEGLDQQQVYTREEYQEFERRRQMDVQRMIEQGLIPPQPVYIPPPHGYHPGMPPHMQPQKIEERKEKSPLCLGFRSHLPFFSNFILVKFTLIKGLKVNIIQASYLKVNIIQDSCPKDNIIRDSCLKDKCPKDSIIKDKCLKGSFNQDKCLKDNTMGNHLKFKRIKDSLKSRQIKDNLKSRRIKDNLKSRRIKDSLKSRGTKDSLHRLQYLKVKLLKFQYLKDKDLGNNLTRNHLGQTLFR
uniref:EF-hand domain-containing protein n=1 Tax=Timema genevievae TaxID=629358 RepID=A0A7R9PR19_TIMGE|nr:unnamed protein product [Timema genevievae]